MARQTAYVWKAVLTEDGIDALRAMPAPGRAPRLGAEQLRALGCALGDKPTAHGFGTELWTLKRVGVLIERMYRVKFGLTQMRCLLGRPGSLDELRTAARTNLKSAQHRSSIINACWAQARLA